MRFVVAAVAGLMVAGGAAAQQAPVGQGLPPNAVISGPICQAGSLRAQHQPTGGGMVWTVAQEDKRPDGRARDMKGPGLHVEFDGVKDSVKTLELSVSYVPAGTRLMPVQPGMDAKAKELKKTFVLQQEAARRVDADLLVGRSATITRVHVVSVTYADGSVWRAPNEDACSVAPDLFMLVAGK